MLVHLVKAEYFGNDCKISQTKDSNTTNDPVPCFMPSQINIKHGQMAK